MGSDVVVTMPKPLRRTGRPGHLTPETHAAFIEQLRKGISIRYAARLAGLKPGTVEKWIQRGRGNLERPATPEYVQFVEAIEDARAGLVGQLAGYVLEGAKADHTFALRILDRLDPNWMATIGIAERRDEPEDEDRAYLRPGGGGAVALEEPQDDAAVTVTEHVRTISIPADRISEFTRLIRGKDPNDPSARLSRFRETEGDVPTG